MKRIRFVHEAWIAASRPRHRAFHRALDDPERAQRTILERLLGANATCAYGRRHGFAGIDGPQRFRERVPVSGWADLAPWVDRIRCGERAVLTTEPVLRLVPTGGSSEGPKLIPWTRGLRLEFARAIAPWVVDLHDRFPALRDGPAYWSISPSLDLGIESSVPVGLEDDAAYLGGPLRHIAKGTLAVPEQVARIRDAEAFRWTTLLMLLRARELRLISVWHPSFLALLFEPLPLWWDGLLDDLERGTLSPPGVIERRTRRELETVLTALPGRARELRDAGPDAARDIWPRLAVVSCWTDAHAARAVPELERLLPDVAIEPKGLVATEGMVSIPFGGARPAAVTSHYLEFRDDRGREYQTHELQDGAEYTVVITTAGGLWRYRLGDRVRVEGFLGRTPSLRFLGRDDGVSDRVGEKLAEAHVAAALSATLGGTAEPQFAMVAPDDTAELPGYTLYIEAEGELPAGLAARLDDALASNPYYAHARRFGQLAPLRVFRIRGGARAVYAVARAATGQRLGSVKEEALSTCSRWSTVFEGAYVEGVARSHLPSITRRHGSARQQKSFADA